MCTSVHNGAQVCTSLHNRAQWCTVYPHVVSINAKAVLSCILLRANTAMSQLGTVKHNSFAQMATRLLKCGLREFMLSPPLKKNIKVPCSGTRLSMPKYDVRKGSAGLG